MTDDKLGQYIQITYQNFWDIECNDCGNGMPVYGKAYIVYTEDSKFYRCKDCQRKKQVVEQL